MGDRRERLTIYGASGSTVGSRGAPVLRRTTSPAPAVALWAGCALADEIPGAKPGDEALSCEQIYAQGMAESLGDQQARDQRTQAMRAQQQSLMGTLGVAIATGGMVGGKAVQKSGEEVLAPQGRIAETANLPNARKHRLRQLWAEKQSVAPGAPGGSKPADEDMTCEQIAAEMAPQVQHMPGTVQANLASQQQLMNQATAVSEKQRADDAALSSLATAGALDPTGASKRAYQAGVIALRQKHAAESRALADSPQAKQAEGQRQQMMARVRQMQTDGRLQQLMRLGHQKGCYH
jgi:hypothetical protein